ncbi:hypothetical protein ABH942_000595 [Flavobacterium sp. 28YEA47A]|uniref:hypothetical protein n=1 Tax=Flavobacterium sp. 28YEA47A TaxID=3156276 RepID=UPI0035115DF2
MKKLLFTLSAIFLLSIYSNAKGLPPATKKESIFACRTFTIEVSIGFISVSTDVRICCDPNGYGSWNCYFVSTDGGNKSTKANISNAVNEIKRKTGITDIKEVRITKSSEEKFEDGKTYIVQNTVYEVQVDKNNYYIIPKIINK